MQYSGQMTLETLFKIAGDIVLPAWILLLAAPGWRWTQRIATFVVPLLLAGLYLWLLTSSQPPAGAGFNSLAQVRILFSAPQALLAGWIHYLVFDLFTGAWQAREAARLRISRWFVAPCLILTFFFGPVGLALFLLIRFGMRRELEAK